MFVTPNPSHLFCVTYIHCKSFTIPDIHAPLPIAGPIAGEGVVYSNMGIRGKYSPAVIREFEQGTVSCVTDLASSSGMGQTVHTLTIYSQSQSISACGPPDHRPVLTGSEGCVRYLVVACTYT